MTKTVFTGYFELIFWVSSLIFLAITDPTQQTHFTLCPLKQLGFSWCPGCGLGRSISFLLHGDLSEAIKAHWLGVPAVILIGNRIYRLVRIKFTILMSGSHYSF